MFGRIFGSKQTKKGSDFEIVDDDGPEDSIFLRELQINLTRLIVYCESADVTLQREVAEKLANEAVKPDRQVQIVQFGGLKLLVPLTKSLDHEVQRLAAHALANLSVNSDNQRLMAQEGGIECLIALLESPHELVQRQSAKALANLGVNNDNKQRIADSGGLPRLVRLAGSRILGVRIEAVAALANLAVNDNNEVEIVRVGGVEPIVNGIATAAEGLTSNSARSDKELQQLEELATQCCRALRNLSVNPENKGEIVSFGALPHLHLLANYPSERISPQARKALKNLEFGK